MIYTLTLSAPAGLTELPHTLGAALPMSQGCRKHLTQPSAVPDLRIEKSRFKQRKIAIAKGVYQRDITFDAILFLFFGFRLVHFFWRYRIVSNIGNVFCTAAAMALAQNVGCAPVTPPNHYLIWALCLSLYLHTHLIHFRIYFKQLSLCIYK